MACVGAYLSQKLLNVSLKQSASFVSPATLGLALCCSPPNSLSMIEPASSIGYTPQSITFSSVGANGTIASNANAITFGTFNTKTTMFGMVVKDTLAASSAVNTVGLGNMHFFGAFSSPASLVCSSGDTVTLAAGALTITLA